MKDAIVQCQTHKDDCLNALLFQFFIQLCLSKSTIVEETWIGVNLNGTNRHYKLLIKICCNSILQLIILTEHIISHFKIQISVAGKKMPEDYLLDKELKVKKVLAVKTKTDIWPHSADPCVWLHPYLLVWRLYRDLHHLCLQCSGPARVSVALRLSCWHA